MSNLKRLSIVPIEIIRALDSGDNFTIEGYAAVFNSPSRILMEQGVLFIESIKEYAFTKALDNLPNSSIDCVASYNHDRTKILARTSSGTLNLIQDEKGLKFSFVLPKTTLGNDVYEMLQRGDISKCSFIASYNPSTVITTRGEDGMIHRLITEFTAIKDISLVIDAAYSETEVYEIKRELEAYEAEEKEKALQSVEDTSTEKSIDEEVPKDDVEEIERPWPEHYSKEEKEKMKEENKDVKKQIEADLVRLNQLIDKLSNLNINI